MFVLVYIVYPVKHFKGAIYNKFYLRTYIESIQLRQALFDEKTDQNDEDKAFLAKFKGRIACVLTHESILECLAKN